MRRAARTDDNQKLIVHQLRACGLSVAVTSSLGAGFPDLVIGYKGKNLLIELKDGNKTKSQQKLTEAEKEFKDNWRGQYVIATTTGEILEILKAIDNTKKNR